MGVCARSMTEGNTASEGVASNAGGKGSARPSVAFDGVSNMEEEDMVSSGEYAGTDVGIGAGQGTQGGEVELR